MKFSYRWIAELVSGLSMDAPALQRLITMKTAECEGIEAFGSQFAQARIVRVSSLAPIAGSRNRLVDIDAGSGALRRVVCGAPNVRPGMLAVWLPPGTGLQGKLIGTAVIDGVQSEGMLASASELQVGRDHAGILELSTGTPGDPLPGVAPDWIIEIDNKSLTHRPDLWGHHGMAREVAAIAGRPLLDPVSAGELPSAPSSFLVDITDFELCPRYSLLVFEEVQVQDSPPALAARLDSIGLNPISNVVDITNYVLAELPQPMHAFDADKLAGNTIFVRKAHAGERLAALNGETYHLHPQDLVIADASGVIALAGVIGGMSTAISESTTRIVLESANFAAASVRLTSVRHKLRTDASARFEKSLDPENTVRGLHRAHALLRQYCRSARPAGGIVDLRRQRPALPFIELPANYVSRKLGKQVANEEISRVLTSLGFGITETDGAAMKVSVPTWRATKDVSNKADLVEEVGRMIGYGEITPSAPAVASVVPPSDPLRHYLRKVRVQLAQQGFTEIYSYSFVNQAEAAHFEFSETHLLTLANPIAAELSHLRPSLLPGVFRSVIANVRHLREFRLFEIGREIRPRLGAALPEEDVHAVGAIYSAHADEQEFFELKRVLECVLPTARVNPAGARSYEHPARTAAISWRGAALGRLFELHPALLEAEGVEGRVVMFDLDLSLASRLSRQQPWTYTPPRRYPTSGLDLSVITALKTPVAEIYDGLVELAGSDLALIEFVRQYDGPPLVQGQKSVTYHLQIGAVDHTVTAEEVTAIRNRILDGMRQRGFEFRE